MLNQSRLKRLPRKLKITGMQPLNFRVMTRVKLDSLLKLVKALRKVENLMECHTTLERVVARRAKEKCSKEFDFNPSVVNSESLVDTEIGIGESAIKKSSVGLTRKSTRRAIHLRTRGKETFVNGHARQRKGKVTASPRAKAKAKARVSEKNIQE